jgi:TonB family protein
MKTLMQQGAAEVLLLAAVFAVVATHSRAQEPAEVTRKVLVKTPPTYPTLAQSMHIRGVVKVEVQIAPNGSVKSVQVKGGHPILVQAAVTAVGHWKFEPAPHETSEVIEVKFDQD